MKNILITGANRGIGFELTQMLAKRGERVFATCRRPEEADALQKLSVRYSAHVCIVQLDVADDASVAAALQAVSRQTQSLDWLLNNAGINEEHRFANFDADQMLRTLNVNAVGAMRVSHTFVDLLRRGERPLLVNVSSQLGSLTKARKRWGNYSYNASKAALNMITRHLSFDLANDGITVIALHPGWVQTDMGGKSAAVTLPDSAAGIINVLDNLTPEDNGRFYTYKGDIHPW